MGNQGKKKVVIYGGGIGGAQLAKRLSGTAHVTLVDPLDYFEIPMAAPRSLISSDYAERAIMPFTQVLPQVEHIRAKLVELGRDGGLVEDGSGRQSRVSGDVSILATGSRFANELMRAYAGSATERKAFYERFRRRLATARRVLIVGGGPIGVEVAGEISENHPDISITILEAGGRLLNGTSAAAATHAASVLEGRGVVIVTGEKLAGDAQPTDDVFAPGGEASTSAGRRIRYDLILWCIGGRPNTAYMQRHFSDKLNSSGRIRVTPNLSVVGQDTLFAIGDITDLAENKMALHVRNHVKVAEANVRATIADAGRNGALTTYKAQTGNQMMAVTLGSRMGVAHLPLFGVVRAGWLIRKAKAEHMLVPNYRKVFGV